jgi:hypothetical protein
MTFTRVTVLTSLLLCCAGSAGAQVTLEFHDGLVNLNAQNAPLRTILNEWARLGGTQVVNADRLTGSPVTLQLTDVPETQALDIILRGTAGYIAGQRTSASATNQSLLDRIMVVPTAGTANVVAARPATPQAPPFQQIAQPFVQPDPDDNALSDVPDDDRPNRAVRPGAAPVLRMVAPNGQGPNQGPQPFVIEDSAPQGPSPNNPATPANPFGATVGAARPGMPAPQPAPPQRPPNTRDAEP